jgi:hypothetical protein
MTREISVHQVPSHFPSLLTWQNGDRPPTSLANCLKRCASRPGWLGPHNLPKASVSLIVGDSLHGRCLLHTPHGENEAMLFRK